MKKTNLAKKGLMPAVLGAVCSVVALTSVSYAWFTMGDTSRVEEIDVNVQAAGGMQISADAATWKTILPVGDLKKETETTEWPTAVDSEGNPLGILPTSTVGEYKAVTENGPQRQQMFLGTVNDHGVLEADASKAAGNYIAFDLYVKVDEQETLVLDAGSYVKGLNANIDSELAVRVSFAHFGSTKLTPNDAKALNTVSSKLIWEPNANYHTQEVINNGKATQDTVQANFEGVSGVGEDGKTANTATLAENLVFQTEYKGDNGVIGVTKDLFVLGEGTNKIRVYIWLEGQDVDCVNSVSGEGFAVGLNFKLKEKQKPAEPTEE